MFLTHGSTGTNGSSQRYLAGDLDPCSDRGAEPQSSDGKALKAAQAGIRHYFHKKYEDGPAPIDGAPGPVGPADRIQPECPASGTSVSDPHQSGPRLNPATDVRGHEEMACLREDHTTKTRSGGSDVGDLVSTGGAVGTSQSYRRDLERSGEDVPDQRQWTDAILEMGSTDTNAEANKGRNDVGARMSTGSTEPDQTGQGSHHHAPLQRPDQADGPKGSIDPVVVAHVEPQPTRSMGGSTAIVLSRHLAAHPLPDQATEHREVAIGQADTETIDRRIVRILLNHKNLCYINSFIISLAWVTLLMQGLELQQWPLGGFELFRSLTALSGLPLNLAVFRPFLWLLSKENEPGWTLMDLEIQNDVTEFGHWFLWRTKPGFVNCRWVSQLLRLGLIEEQNGTERGDQHGPILIPLHDPKLVFMHPASSHRFLPRWLRCLPSNSTGGPRTHPEYQSLSARDWSEESAKY